MHELNFLISIDTYILYGSFICFLTGDYPESVETCSR
jgi:hypothetical protein